MDSLKKIKLTAGLSATLLLGGGAAVRDVTVLDIAPIERVEIIAGERVEAKQIDNIVEASFPWKDQPGIKVKYDMGEPTVEEKFSDVRKKQIITETVTDFEGGFKVDIILSERPDTNRFCYTIEGAENYDFFYQPPLTEEEIAEGAERPPEIEGSYAVYHKTLKNHIEGRTNYATGKVMHIPRPQVWEVGNEEATKEWADLLYENDELCVIPDQTFLDKATYPVRIDPTFGYTSVGASNSTNRAANRAEVGRKTLTEGGTVTMVSIAEHISNGTPQTKAVIYDDDGAAGIPGTLIAVSSASLVVEATFVDYTVSVPLAAGNWWIGGIVDSLGAQLRYDALGGELGSNDSSDTNSFASPTEWHQSFTNNNRLQSVYATYTADEVETPLTPYATIKGDVQMKGDVYFSP